jgi:hypothetical protein
VRGSASCFKDRQPSTTCKQSVQEGHEAACTGECEHLRYTWDCSNSAASRSESGVAALDARPHERTILFLERLARSPAVQPSTTLFPEERSVTAPAGYLHCDMPTSSVHDGATVSPAVKYWPSNIALIVTVSSSDSGWVFTVKVVLVAPAGMVTLGGTVA